MINIGEFLALLDLPDVSSLQAPRTPEITLIVPTVQLTK